MLPLKDWALSEVVPIFSTTAVCFGCSVWGLGKFMEKVGPRANGVIAAGCWGSGLAVAGKEHSTITPPHADCIL